MADPEHPTTDAPPPTQDQQAREQSAARDLADGLDLMLRAAKKALRNVEAQNLETLGRRALDNLEALNKKRVDELKDKARRSLDPRRIEEIAEDAGKELIRVVERVVERVDGIVTRGSAPPGSDPRADAERDTPPASGQAADAAQEPAGGADAPAHQRVRIEDD